LGSVLISAPLVARYTVRRSVLGVRLRRRAPASAFEGDTVRVALDLTNTSETPLAFPQVGEIFWPEIHAQKRVVFAGRLDPRESVTLQYEGICFLPRGVYRLGPAAVRVGDALGWFEAQRWFEESEALKVYPKIHRLRTGDPAGDCVSWVESDRPTRGLGESEEFRGVREYRRGDSPRRIHWGLSARFGQPIVREFTRIAQGELTVVLDRSSRARVGWGRSSSLEYQLKIALSLVSVHLDRGRRGRIVMADGDRAVELEAQGRTDFPGLLDTLVDFRNGDSHAALPLLLERSAHHRGVIVVMVHPYLHDDTEFERRLVALEGSGRRVLAVLFEGPRLGEGRPDDEIASDSAYEVARRLESRGVGAFVVTCGDAIEAIFAPSVRSERSIVVERGP
ncbi:MAG: DUF58 domain-containing protein, partial [Planctomycetes bacterium]|nr:DUF58 domain-containing protein [Planctomycetota bacterium]